MPGLNTDSVMNNTVFQDSKLFNAVSNLEKNSFKVIGDLIAEGEDVNQRGEYSETYLHVLCAEQEEELAHTWVVPIIYLLTEAGLDVNSKDHEGNTPLHISTLNEVHYTVAVTLIRVGGDPCLLNNKDHDALDLAEDTRLRKVLQYYDPGLWRSVEDGDRGRVKRLVESWCRISVKYNNKKLMSMADDSCKPDLVSYLKGKRNNANMISAALSGKAELLKNVLKKEGVDPDATDSAYIRPKDGKPIKWPLLAEVVRLGLYDCAKVLAKKCNVNVIIQPMPDRDVPLFLWIMEQLREPDISFVKTVVKKADMTLLTDPVAVLYKAWKSRCPVEIMEQLVKRGLCLSTRNPQGCTVRDLIMLDIYTKENRDAISQSLYFIDHHVIEMVKEGNKEDLENLALAGYEYLNVVDRKGNSVMDIAKGENKKDIVTFVENFQQLQKNCVDLQKHVENGNLMGARELMTSKIAKCRDRCGRTILHLAILYERRFIVKYILKQFPEIINYKDVMSRSALHYSCTVTDGTDIQDALISAGADLKIKDMNGMTAVDYKSLASFDFLSMERNKQYGENVHLLDRYFWMQDSIERDSLSRCREIRKSMWDTTLTELEVRVSRRLANRYKPLLIQCLRTGREDIAIYLVQEGSNYDINDHMVDSSGREIEMELVKSAEMKEMHRLVEQIRGMNMSEQENDQMGRECQVLVGEGSDRGSGATSGASTRLSHYRVNGVDTDSNGSQSEIRGQSGKDKSHGRDQMGNDNHSLSPPPAKKMNQSVSPGSQNRSTSCIIL